MSGGNHWGMPPAEWMKKAATYKIPDQSAVVDYEWVAKKFGTTILALRNFSSKVPYPAHRVPNPKGGTIKKFKLSDFVQAVNAHVKAYRAK